MPYSYLEYVPIFKAVSDETRLKILDMLSCGEMCACDILEKFSISQSTLSYHMKILTVTKDMILTADPYHTTQDTLAKVLAYRGGDVISIRRIIDQQ